MKLFNVHFRVQITEIGELEDPKPTLSEGFADGSPIKEMGVLFERLKESGAFPGSSPTIVGPYGEGPGISMSAADTVKVAANSFEELQVMLAKFHATAQSLSGLPVEERKSAAT